jgi:hypothetical protein
VQSPVKKLVDADPVALRRRLVVHPLALRKDKPVVSAWEPLNSVRGSALGEGVTEFFDV